MPHSATIRLNYLLIRFVRLVVVVTVLLQPLAIYAADDLVIASAGKSGTYYKLATLLAEQFNRLSPDRKVKVIETQGSRENASLMEKGLVDFALIQNDVAYLASYYSESMRGLAALYTEPVHILCRRELPWELISDIADSERKIVVGVGPQGSGTFAHANAILKNIDIDQAHLVHDYSSFEDSFIKLKDRQIDILFYTISSPAKIIADYSSQNIVKLLEVGAPLIRKTRKDYPFFVLTEMPYTHYAGMSTNLQSLGVRALLVAQGNTRDEDVRNMLDSLFSIKHMKSDIQDVVDDISEETANLGMNIQLHNFAKKYYKKNESYLLLLAKGVWNYFFPVFILLSILILLIRAPRLLNIIHQYTFGRLLLFSFLIWFIGATVMFLCEGGKNQNFDTFGKSSIAILYYLSSGLESKYPITMIGHITSVVILTLGIAIVTYFTSILVTELVKKSFGLSTLKRKPKYFFKLKNHVIIIGWGERTKRVISQLRQQDIKKPPTILVITEKANETHIIGRKQYKDVWVVEGSISDPDTLIGANLSNAKAALIFSEEPMLPESDNKLIVAGMEVNRLNSDIHIVAEALRPECNYHLKRCDVDEIINITEFSSKLLSQCIISPGILNFYNQVVEFGLDSQEFYFVKVPKSFYEFSFQELQRICQERYVFLPVGFVIRTIDGNSLILNPEKNIRKKKIGDIVELQEAQFELVVLADINPKLKSNTKVFFERDLFTTAVENYELESHVINSDPRRETVKNTRVAICHWTDEAHRIIDHLQTSVLEKHNRYQITVLIDDSEASINGSNASINNVKFCYGDPTRPEVLTAMGLLDIDTLVILADMDKVFLYNDGNKDRVNYADYETLIIAQTAISIKPDIHIVAEVLNSENVGLFNRFTNCELVAVSDLTEKLIAQATITPGLTEVYMRLLTATEDTNEIYFVPIEGALVNKTFSHINEKLITSGIEIIALGYRLGSHDNKDVERIVINPKKEIKISKKLPNSSYYELQKGDALLVMAYEEPEQEVFEKVFN